MHTYDLSYREGEWGWDESHCKVKMIGTHLTYKEEVILVYTLRKNWNLFAYSQNDMFNIYQKVVSHKIAIGHVIRLMVQEK